MAARGAGHRRRPASASRACGTSSSSGCSASPSAPRCWSAPATRWAPARRSRMLGARDPAGGRHPRRRAARGAPRASCARASARHVDREARRAGRRVPRRARRRAVPRRATATALRAARGDPQLMGDGMRRALEDWLAAECAAHPVLLVLEDLHWGDLGTVSFVDAALRNLRDAAAHGAGAGAPRGARALPRPVGRARRRRRSGSAPLARRASEQLVREVLGEVGDDDWSSGSSSAPTATRSTSRS